MNKFIRKKSEVFTHCCHARYSTIVFKSLQKFCSDEGALWWNISESFLDAHFTHDLSNAQLWCPSGSRVAVQRSSFASKYPHHNQSGALATLTQHVMIFSIGGASCASALRARRPGTGAPPSGPGGRPARTRGRLRKIASADCDQLG